MTGKILLAAGGTGGHIIPSIAFGRWLRRAGEEVVWLTGSRELEEKIFQAHGVTPLKISLEGSPLGVRGLRSLKRWKQLAGSFFECRAALRRERVARCVLFGGYLSMPVLLAARSLGIPVLMHEQNTVAGKVTRLASRLNVLVASAWSECQGLKKSRFVTAGLPLRPLALTDRKQAQRELLGAPLNDGEKLIVILGGSLGSGGMKNMLQNSQDMIKSTGCKILCMGIAPEQRPFPEALTHEACWDMSLVYSAADAVVCRAGASTLAELRALGIPVIVVPWAASADDHQSHNARAFAELTGSPVLSENDAPRKFTEALANLPRRRPAESDLNAASVKLYQVLYSLNA